MGSCDNDNDDADDAENDNDNDNDKYRILHGRVGIRILSSRAENISHEWAKRTSKRYFQHEKTLLKSGSSLVIG